MQTIENLGPILLAVNTVANLLSVSPKTVYGWVRERQIKAIKLPGGGIRIPVEEVAEILGMNPVELARRLGLLP